MYLFEMFFQFLMKSVWKLLISYLPTSFKSKDIRPFKNELVTICKSANNF